MEEFLANTYQRLVLNREDFKWAAVKVGVQQGSILGSLMFLIYINDLSSELSSNPRLFADDTSLFLVVRDTDLSANPLNNDLLKINNCIYQWKMSFNPNPSKQAQEVVFCCKIKKPSHPVLIFNNNQIIQTPYQKHPGFLLDERLNFGEHLRYIANKANTSIGLLRKLQKSFPRRSLVTIYKSFIRPHLDYEEVIFNQAYNKSFHQSLESLQYNASFIGAIRDTSKKKLHQELGLESLQHSRWFCKLCTFYKIFKNDPPRYIYELLPLQTTSHDA